jgi:general secretion pathway protein J
VGALERVFGRAVNRDSAGFTLLELLLALGVFAVVSVLSYQGLTQVINVKRGLDAERARLREVHLALGVIQRDLHSTLARPTRDASNRPLPAFSGEPQALEFARLGSGALASGIERVRLSVSRDALLRERTQGGDIAPGSSAPRRVLLDGVEAFAVRYIAPDGGGSSDRFPVGEVSPGVATLPRAVEINLRVRGVGDLRRIVKLPAVPYEGAR